MRSGDEPEMRLKFSVMSTNEKKTKSTAILPSKKKKNGNTGRGKYNRNGREERGKGRKKYEKIKKQFDGEARLNRGWKREKRAGKEERRVGDRNIGCSQEGKWKKVDEQ